MTFPSNLDISYLHFNIWILRTPVREIVEAEVKLLMTLCTGPAIFASVKQSGRNAPFEK